MWHRYIVALNPLCAFVFSKISRVILHFDEIQDLSNKHRYSHMFSLEPAIVTLGSAIVAVKLAVKVTVKLAVKVAANVAIKLAVKESV